MNDRRGVVRPASHIEVANHCRNYVLPSTGRALAQTITTMAVYLVLFVPMAVGYLTAPAAALVLALPASATLLRLCALQREAAINGHARSLDSNASLNLAMSLLTLVPSKAPISGDGQQSRTNLNLVIVPGVYTAIALFSGVLSTVIALATVILFAAIGHRLIRSGGLQSRAAIMTWLTAGENLRSLHPALARVPNYRLRQCIEGNAALMQMAFLTAPTMQAWEAPPGTGTPEVKAGAAEED